MTEQTSKSTKWNKPRSHSSRSKGSDSSHSRRPSSDSDYKGPGTQGLHLTLTSTDSEKRSDSSSFLDQSQLYPAMIGSGAFPSEGDSTPTLSSIIETARESERTDDNNQNIHSTLPIPTSSNSSLAKFKIKKSNSLGRKSQNTTTETHGFEMDESIQKSTIMVKRLRSKSESRKTENEYGDEIDPLDEQHGQTPPYKRQLQNHQSEKAADFMKNQITIPPDVHDYLQPAREDKGCVMCSLSDDNPANPIVFCNNCDRGFHQQCCQPHIENKYIEIEELEWLCYACSLPLSTTSSQGLSAMAEDMSLSGEEIPQDVKENYLNSLSKANLVKLISRIESHSPTIKLYPSHLSSPSTTPLNQDRLISSTVVETTLPFESRAGQDGHGVSPNHLPIQIAQADYFNPYTAQFTSAGSSSGNAQSLINTDNHSQITVAPSSKPPIASDASELPTSSSTPYSSSQPVTPNIASQTGRQTPISGSALTGSYHSVKAQDLPPYEEMIFMAIADLKQEAGSAPKAILDWVQEHYPVPETFRASCGQAISKAAKKGRLLKEGALYKLKPGYNYPRRISRQSGTTRARSQSYNSALPPGISSNRGNAVPGSFDQISPIFDPNIYGMLPGSTVPIQPPSLAPQVYANIGSNAIPSVQPLNPPFKFDAQPFGHPLALQTTGLASGNNSSDPKNRNMTGLIGLGVTNPPSGNTSDSEIGMDSDILGQRSSSISSNSSGQQPLSSNIQGSGTLAIRSLHPQRSQPSQQAFPYDRTFLMNTGTSLQSPGGLVRMPPTPGKVQTPGMFPRQVYPARVSGMASPLQFPTTPFGELGSITIPTQPQPQSPQSHTTFLSQTPVTQTGLSSINPALQGHGARTGAPMFPSIFIPQALQLSQPFPQSQQNQQQQQFQQQQQLQQQQQQHMFPAQTTRLYGTTSLPASPQDIAPQFLSSQSLLREPGRMPPNSIVGGTPTPQQQQQQQQQTLQTNINANAAKRYSQPDGTFSPSANPGSMLFYQQFTLQQQQQQQQQQQFQQHQQQQQFLVEQQGGHSQLQSIPSTLGHASGVVDGHTTSLQVDISSGQGTVPFNGSGDKESPMEETTT